MRKLLSLSLLLMAFTFVVNAENRDDKTATKTISNRWNVYAGGSISHNCKRFKWLLDGSTGFNWGGGALIGAGYQIGLAQRWSLTPALELSFNDNGAYLNKSGKPLNPDWGGQLSVNTWASYWAM
ncbi:MAG: hypothetical protein HDS22_07330, partial [Bacteroides sp.]|nr:hypothetical protein [Bacteroides sp.]